MLQYLIDIWFLKRKIGKFWLLVYSIAFIGSIFKYKFRMVSIKPPITPSNWIFPIVWDVLFFLIALSIYFNWMNSKNNEKKKIVIVYEINFILNILWGVFYFGMKNPFIEIIFLWFSILSMIILSFKIKKKASYLLIPYLLWVSFTIILNRLSIK